MDNPSEINSFDMGALRSNLPQRGGLSRYYSEKSRSFECMADVRCLEDLKKQEHGDAKRRKKYSGREEMHYPLHSFTTVSCGTQFVATPMIVGT